MLDVVFFGGAGNDRVVLDFEPLGDASLDPADRIILDGGAGTDTLVISADPTLVSARRFEILEA
jgi:hypothetical protein